MNQNPPARRAHGIPLALAEPVRRVGPRWIGCISLANLVLWMGYFGPLQVLLPQQIAAADPTGKETALAWVTGVGAAVAMVGNPVAGALSDRTAGRFGRRHPWTLSGAVAGGLGLVFLAFQGSVAGVVAGWCVAQAGLNAMQAALTAGVPDHVPVSQRGAVSGWVGIPQALGVVLAAVVVTMVATTTTSGYVLIGGLVPLGVLPFVLATPDIPLPAGRRRFTLTGFLRGFWVSPRRHPDFAWAWITRFLMQLGNSIALLYMLYFLTDAVHYEQVFPGHKAADGLLVLIVIYTVAVVPATVTSGVISDRTGRRKTLVAMSGMISAIAAVLMALWPLWPVVVAAAVIMGVGFGVYLSVDNALVTQVLPAAEGRAKDLGVINIAGSGPQVLGPVIAGPVVAGLGYPALYLTAAVLTLLGAGLVWKIRSVP